MKVSLGILGSLLPVLIASHALGKEHRYEVEDLLHESALAGVFAVELIDSKVQPARSEELVQTRIVIRAESLLYGTWPGGQLEFLLPMGVMPDGTEVVWTDVPRLCAGERYLLFIREGDWHVSPFVGGSSSSFRFADIGTKEFLVDTDGYAVTSLESFPRFRTAPIAATEDELLAARVAGTQTAFSRPSDIIINAAARNSHPREALLVDLDRRVRDFRNRFPLRRESGVVYREPEPIHLTGRDRARSRWRSWG